MTAAIGHQTSYGTLTVTHMPDARIIALLILLLADGEVRMDGFVRRIQRKRIKGWRMPPRTKYAGRPGPLGNPFTEGTKADRAQKYRQAFYAGELQIDEDFVRSELAEFDFVCCWCREDEPCHCDLFVEIMNAV